MSLPGTKVCNDAKKKKKFINLNSEVGEEEEGRGKKTKRNKIENKLKFLPFSRLVVLTPQFLLT